MKKNLLALFALSAFNFVSGQIMFTDHESGSFGMTNFNMRCMETYNGKIYIGGGDYNPDSAKVGVSADGATGTFSQDLSFSTISSGKDDQHVNVLKASAAGNFLFAATDIYADDSHVYRFDGSNWIDFGNIPYPFGDSSWYAGITAMETFTSTGSNDSIYIALSSSGNGNINGIGTCIFRTSVNNPGWVFVDSLGINDGSVNDFSVFNNQLFFCTDYNTRVFASATGTNFTAVSDTGLYAGSFLQEITCLEVFNAELYAGGSAGGQTFAEIWKTSDGLNWTQVGPTGINPGFDVDIIKDLKVSNNNLYVLGVEAMAAFQRNSQNASSSMFGNQTQIYSYDGTNYTQTDLNSISTSSDNGSWALLSYQNSLYAGGPNFAVTNHLYKGYFPPTASFNLSNDTTCLFSSITGYNTSTGYDSTEWFINTNIVSYIDTTPLGFYSTTGPDTVMLIVYNGPNSDTVSQIVFVGNQFSVDSINYISASVCATTPTNYSVFTSGGTSPFTYSWQYSGSSAGTQQTITLSPAASSTLSVSCTDHFGCTAFSSGFVNVLSSTDIVGTINYSSGQVANGNVYLIKQGASSALYDTVSVVSISAAPAGDFIFTGIPAGGYIIRAEANSGTYPLLVNTYYGDHYLWDSALTAIHGCSAADTNNIMMVELPVLTGPGSIHGTVYEGIGFGQKLILGPVGVMTNVIPGVPVKVGKNPGGAIVQTGLTDVNGQFDFMNLPYDNYKIYTDIPGYPMDSSYAVTLSAATDSLINLDYYVDSNSVYIDLTTAIHFVSKNTSSVRIYPNPSNGQIKIQTVELNNSKGLIRIFDVSGRLVFSSKENSFQSNSIITIDLDANEISSGTYFLEIPGTPEKYKIVVIKN
ncbi:MAG: T9SS type A sorting domain-containing protein [Bacteroidia bacterium]|nr:T9SS type A sorting domain-containing protein [Bacteroidia bacterium]